MCICVCVCVCVSGIGGFLWEVQSLEAFVQTLHLQLASKEGPVEGLEMTFVTITEHE